VTTLERLAPFVVKSREQLGELSIEVTAATVVEACRTLKEDLNFERLSSVTAVDRYPSEPRFEVVYHLQSITRNERLRLKVLLGGEDPQIDSVTGVWRAANWFERETYDMFGIRFRNHPDLRRILMPDDWEGHPLRKDYPITGPMV
jgi:NADH-quinone oxidoreductase subunit C